MASLALTSAKADQPAKVNHPAHERNHCNKLNIGARLSTLGIQGEIAYRFNKTFALRLQSGGYDHLQDDLSYDKKDYHDIRFRPIVTALYADWYFWKDWWRASAGVSYNHTKFRVKEKLYRNIPFIGPMFVGVAHLNYRYKSHFSPYIGTGVDFHIPSCWAPDFFPCLSNVIVSLDAGMNFFSKVKAKAKMSGLAALDPTAVSQAEKKGAKLLNDQWWIRYYPTFSIGIKYEL